MPRLAVHDPKGSCTPKRPAPSLCTARVYGGRIPRSLVHTRSRAARQRPMQGGALHHRAFCVNFSIESLPGSTMSERVGFRPIEDRLGLARAVKPCASGAPLRGCEALPPVQPKPWATKPETQGSIRNFEQCPKFRVWGRAVAPVQAMARVKRSPKRMANCALAMHHSRAGMATLSPISSRPRTTAKGPSGRVDHLD